MPSLYILNDDKDLVPYYYADQCFLHSRTPTPTLTQSTIRGLLYSVCRALAMT